MPTPKDLLFFDIETGGLDPRQNPLVSIAHATGAADPTTLYAQPRPGSRIGSWAARFVGDLPGARQSRQTEQQTIERFTGLLEANRGRTLAGWNIGYGAGRGGFDLPFLTNVAERYGMGERFRTAVSGMKIRDIGREYSWQIAQEVTKPEYAHLLDPDIRQQAVGYLKSGQRDLGFDPARSLGLRGKYFAGWKQEQVHGLLGLGGYQAHGAAADVAAMQRMGGAAGKLEGPEFVQAWGRTTLHERLIKAAKAGAAPTDREGFFEGLLQRGRKYGVVGWEKELESEIKELGGDFERVRAGRGFKEPAGMVQGTLRQRMAASKFWKVGEAALPHLKRNWVFYGAAALIGAAQTLEPMGWFSGRDDAWNTIEGLTHKGMAGKDRKQNTEFGSGFLRRITDFIGLGKSEEEYAEDRQARWQQLTVALEQYGKKVGTGHERILVPKQIITPEDVRKLGFISSYVAIPEMGQSRLRTFRHTSNPYHLHEHGEYWSVHKDRHMASSMVIARMKKRGEDVTRFDVAKETVMGLPHLITEGLPGLYYYLRGQFTGGTSMSTRLQRSLSPEYERLMVEMSGGEFSGFDDSYNVIEGLRHEGMAGPMRKTATDFGSGVNLAKAAARAKGFYQNMAEHLLSQRGVKNLEWKAVHTKDFLSLQAFSGNERMFELKRYFRGGKVDLNKIEIAEQLRGQGFGKEFYLAERAFLSKHAAGVPTTSTVTSPITKKLQERFYGATGTPLMKSMPDMQEMSGRIPGFQEGGLNEELRKILTDFGSPVDLFKAAARAEKMYKGLLTKQLARRGVKSKDIQWLTDISAESSGPGWAVSVVAQTKGPKKEMLAGLSRSFGRAEIDLTSIEIAERFRGGMGKAIYQAEESIFRKLGYKAGEKITSAVSSPITARMQMMRYRSKIDPHLASRIKNLKAMENQVMSKRITKDDFPGLTLTGTLQAKERLSFRKLREALSLRSTQQRTSEAAIKGSRQRARQAGAIIDDKSTRPF